MGLAVLASVSFQQRLLPRTIFIPTPQQMVRQTLLNFHNDYTEENNVTRRYDNDKLL
ncbi:MAG: hypothetical protein R2778_16630 [Saprospiraceae bacterium]